MNDECVGFGIFCRFMRQKMPKRFLLPTVQGLEKL